MGNSAASSSARRSEARKSFKQKIASVCAATEANSMRSVGESSWREECLGRTRPQYFRDFEVS